MDKTQGLAQPIYVSSIIELVEQKFRLLYRKLSTGEVLALYDLAYFYHLLGSYWYRGYKAGFLEMLPLAGYGFTQMQEAMVDAPGASVIPWYKKSLILLDAIKSQLEKRESLALRLEKKLGQIELKSSQKNRALQLLAKHYLALGKSKKSRIILENMHKRDEILYESAQRLSILKNWTSLHHQLLFLSETQIVMRINPGDKEFLKAPEKLAKNKSDLRLQLLLSGISTREPYLAIYQPQHEEEYCTLLVTIPIVTGTPLYYWLLETDLLSDQLVLSIDEWLDAFVEANLWVGLPKEITDSLLSRHGRAIQLLYSLSGCFNDSVNIHAPFCNYYLQQTEYVKQQQAQSLLVRELMRRATIQPIIELPSPTSIELELGQEIINDELSPPFVQQQILPHLDKIPDLVKNVFLNKEKYLFTVDSEKLIDLLPLYRIEPIESLLQCRNNLRQHVLAHPEQAWFGIIDCGQNHYVLLAVVPPLSSEAIDPTSKPLINCMLFDSRHDRADAKILAKLSSLLAESWPKNMMPAPKWIDVVCSRQRKQGEDSILHAYLNGLAAYAIWCKASSSDEQENIWSEFIASIHEQPYAAINNIDCIKKWLLENKTILISESNEQEIDPVQAIQLDELLKKFSEENPHYTEKDHANLLAKLKKAGVPLSLIKNNELISHKLHENRQKRIEENAQKLATLKDKLLNIRECLIALMDEEFLQEDTRLNKNLELGKDRNEWWSVQLKENIESMQEFDLSLWLATIEGSLKGHLLGKHKIAQQLSAEIKCLLENLPLDISRDRKLQRVVNNYYDFFKNDAKRGSSHALQFLYQRRYELFRMMFNNVVAKIMKQQSQQELDDLQEWPKLALTLHDYCIDGSINDIDQQKVIFARLFELLQKNSIEIQDFSFESFCTLTEFFSKLWRSQAEIDSVDKGVGEVIQAGWASIKETIKRLATAEFILALAQESEQVEYLLHNTCVSLQTAVKHNSTITEQGRYFDESSLLGEVLYQSLQKEIDSVDFYKSLVRIGKEYLLSQKTSIVRLSSEKWSALFCSAGDKLVERMQHDLMNEGCNESWFAVGHERVQNQLCNFAVHEIALRLILQATRWAESMHHFFLTQMRFAAVVTETNRRTNPKSVASKLLETAYKQHENDALPYFEQLFFTLQTANDYQDVPNCQARELASQSKSMLTLLQNEMFLLESEGDIPALTFLKNLKNEIQPLVISCYELEQLIIEQEFFVKFRLWLGAIYDALDENEIQNSVILKLEKQLKECASFKQIENLLNDLSNELPDTLQGKQHSEEIKQCIAILENIDEKCKKDKLFLYSVANNMAASLLLCASQELKALMAFRVQAHKTIEHFYKSLRGTYLNEIYQMLQRPEAANITIQPLPDFPMGENNNPLSQKELLIKHIRHIEEKVSKKSFSLAKAAIAMRKQLENESVHIKTIFSQHLFVLSLLSKRLAESQTLLRDFVITLKLCLQERYENLAEGIVFGVRGLIAEEILQPLSVQKTCSDLINIVEGVFAEIGPGKKLNNLLQKLQHVLSNDEHPDEQAQAQISEWLREITVKTVQGYASSLLSFRLTSLNLFDAFEKELSSILSSYQALKILHQSQSKGKIPIFSSSSYTSIAEKQAGYVQQMQAIKEQLAWAFPDKRNSIYSKLEQILQSKKHSHTTYIDAKLKQLEQLLLLCLFPIFKQEDDISLDDRQIFSITAVSTTLSCLRSLLEKNHVDLKPNDEIRILCTDTLYVDCDLLNNAKKFHGVSLSIIAPNIQLANGVQRFNLCTNGQHGADLPNKKAEKGCGQKNDGTGCDGKDGIPGNSGGHAGHVHFVTDALPPVAIVANGGNGSNGQAGGNGFKGKDGDGGRYHDYDDRKLFNECKRELSRQMERVSGSFLTGKSFFTGFSWLRGTPGQPGHLGGFKGANGQGGMYGEKGEITLIQLHQHLPYSIEHKDGNKGKDGKGAKDGECGYQGEDGLTACIMVHRERDDWVTFDRRGRSDNRGIEFYRGYVNSDSNNFCSSHVRWDDSRGKVELSDDSKSKYGVKLYQHVRAGIFWGWTSDDLNPRADTPYLRKATPRQQRQQRERKPEEQRQERLICCKPLAQVHLIKKADVHKQGLKLFKQVAMCQHWQANKLQAFTQAWAQELNLPQEQYNIPDQGLHAQTLQKLSASFTHLTNSHLTRLQQSRLNLQNLSIGMVSVVDKVNNRLQQMIDVVSNQRKQLTQVLQSQDLQSLTTGLSNFTDQIHIPKELSHCMLQAKLGLPVAYTREQMLTQLNQISSSLRKQVEKSVAQQLERQQKRKQERQQQQQRQMLIDKPTQLNNRIHSLRPLKVQFFDKKRYPAIVNPAVLTEEYQRNASTVVLQEWENLRDPMLACLREKHQFSKDESETVANYANWLLNLETVEEETEEIKKTERTMIGRWIDLSLKLPLSWIWGSENNIDKKIENKVIKEGKKEKKEKIELILTWMQWHLKQCAHNINAEELLGIMSLIKQINDLDKLIQIIASESPQRWPTLLINLLLKQLLDPSSIDDDDDARIIDTNVFFNLTTGMIIYNKLLNRYNGIVPNESEKKELLDILPRLSNICALPERVSHFALEQQLSELSSLQWNELLNEIDFIEEVTEKCEEYFFDQSSSSAKKTLVLLNQLRLQLKDTGLLNRLVTFTLSNKYFAEKESLTSSQEDERHAFLDLLLSYPLAIIKLERILNELEREPENKLAKIKQIVTNENGRERSVDEVINWIEKESVNSDTSVTNDELKSVQILAKKALEIFNKEQDSLHHQQGSSPLYLVKRFNKASCDKLNINSAMFLTEKNELFVKNSSGEWLENDEQQPIGLIVKRGKIMPATEDNTQPQTIEQTKEVLLFIENAQKLIQKAQLRKKLQERFKELRSLKSYQNDPEGYINNNLSKIVADLVLAWSLVSNQTIRDVQLVAVCLIVQGKHGLLEQVKTGEGKTIIVGFVAALKALCGYKVDILSSNRDLAMDGASKCQKFFEELGLSSSHNCHTAVEERKKFYEKAIVYGEIGIFQGDMLETEFEGKNTTGTRYTKKENNKIDKNYLIVDEVDNMCLDKARNVLYLSHSIDCLKWLEPFFVTLWATALGESIQENENVEQHILRVRDQLWAAIQQREYLEVPEYLENFIQNKLIYYVRSAFEAIVLRINDDYILGLNKNNTENSRLGLVIMDKDTGTEQFSSQWSNGLAQFLELKFRRAISVESLKAVFMSNKAFFKRYGSNFCGLTGTLGSQQAQQFLHQIYGRLKMVIIPTAKEKRFCMKPSHVVTTSEDWYELIVKETLKIAAERPVLIIVENIEKAEALMQALSSSGKKPVPYFRDGDEVEHRYAENPARAGDIIVATNKGGRGTDIMVDPSINAGEGLHVILGYMPSNSRIEEQAFGRTCRNGAPGTGQFIIRVDEAYAQTEDSAERAIYLEKNAAEIISQEMKKRDQEESLILEQLMCGGIISLDAEEELLIIFRQLLIDISNEISPSEFDEEEIKWLTLVLKDNWAFWLDASQPEIQTIKTEEQKLAIKKRFVIEFYNKYLSKVGCRLYVMPEFKDEYSIGLVSTTLELTEQMLEKKSQQHGTIPLLIKKLDKFEIWGCFKGQWKKTKLKYREDIAVCKQLEFEAEPELVKKLTTLKDSAIFSILKKGHTPSLPSNYEYYQYSYILAKKQKTLYYINPLAKNSSKVCEKIYIKKYQTFLDTLNQLHKFSADQEICLSNSQAHQLITLSVSHTHQKIAKTRLQQLLDFSTYPEHVIKLGHIQNEILARRSDISARKCFEISSKQDPTGFSYLGLAQQIIKTKTGEKEEDKSLKKEVRKNLKEAHRRLDKLKRGYASNKAVVDHLASLMKNDENMQRVLSAGDNFYAKQIQGKLEVLGLHLNLIEQFAGRCLLPEDFNFLDGNVNKASLAPEEKKPSEKLYDSLVDKGIIYHQKLRQYYQKKPNLIKNILDNKKLDPSIKDSVFDLLTNNPKRINRTSLQKIVCSSKELWETLGLQGEKVYVLQDTKSLPLELNEKLNALIEKGLNKDDVKLSIFNEEVDLKEHLFKHKKIINMRRVNVHAFKEALEQLDKYKFSAPYEKYGRVVFFSEGENKSIFKFLKDLLEVKKQALLAKGDFELKGDGAYIYESQLPYGSKEEEAAKIMVFLAEQEIIKSGGLACTERFEKNERLREVLIKRLEGEGYGSHLENIINTICSAQGKLRAYRDGVKCHFLSFTALTPENSGLSLEQLSKIPSELDFFKSLGFDRFLVLEEDKRFRFNWNIFALVLIGLAQIALGALLNACGLVNLGEALIAEGISDLVYATMAMITGTFSWKDWAIQKALSISLSLCTMGASAFESMGKSGLGGLSKAQIFGKSLLRAAGKFTVELGMQLITHYGLQAVLEEALNTVIDEIVDLVCEQLEKIFKAPLTMTVTAYHSASNDDEHFEQQCNDLENKIHELFGQPQVQEKLNAEQMFNAISSILSAISSAGQNSGGAIKVAANICNAAQIVVEVSSVIKKTVFVVKVLQGICDELFAGEHANQQTVVQVDAKVKELFNVLRTDSADFIQEKVVALIRRAFEKIIQLVTQKIDESTQNPLLQNASQKNQEKSPFPEFKKIMNNPIVKNVVGVQSAYAIDAACSEVERVCVEFSYQKINFIFNSFMNSMQEPLIAIFILAKDSSQINVEFTSIFNVFSELNNFLQFIQQHKFSHLLQFMKTKWNAFCKAKNPQERAKALGEITIKGINTFNEITQVVSDIKRHSSSIEESISQITSIWNMKKLVGHDNEKIRNQARISVEKLKNKFSDLLSDVLKNALGYAIQLVISTACKKQPPRFNSCKLDRLGDNLKEIFTQFLKEAKAAVKVTSIGEGGNSHIFSLSEQPRMPFLSKNNERIKLIDVKTEVKKSHASLSKAISGTQSKLNIPNFSKPPKVELFSAQKNTSPFFASIPPKQLPTLTKKLPIDKPAINPIKVNVFTKNKSTFFARHKQLTPEGLIPEFIHDDAEATWVTDDDAQQFCQQNGINDFKGIVRDGNCFFRTILAALPEHPWSQHPDGHQILRERAVQYIRNNLTQFSLYYKETAPLENYLNRMEQPTQWAEGIIIEATALLLNITIDMIGLEKIANEIATTGRFTASEPRNALGKILMLRVNQNHYHLGGISWTQGEINRFSVCLSP